MVFSRDFDRLTPFISAFRPMLARQLEQNVEDTYKQMTRQWEQGNDAMGRPWEPLAPSTVRQKGHSTPLIETRQMIDSASYEVRRDDLVGVISIEDEEGKVLAHEHGVPDQGLPARPILQPAMEYTEQDAGKLLTKAFDKSWAQAQLSGTSAMLGFGGGARLGSGGGR